MGSIILECSQSYIHFQMTAIEGNLNYGKIFFFSPSATLTGLGH